MKRMIAIIILPGMLFPFTGHATSHKVQVSDPATAQRIIAKGGRLMANYGSYQLYAVDTVGRELAGAANAEIRDDYDHIELNAGMINTVEPAATALRKPVGTFKGKHTHLVQFIGPVQPAWRAALEETGIRIVCYIPQNAYLIFGDADSLARVQKLATTTDFLQWENTYSVANKVHPRARLMDINGNTRAIGTDFFEIQLVADDEMNPETLKLIDTLKLTPISCQSKRLGYVNLVVSVAPASLDQIAGQPDVVSIQPYFVPEKFCERQDQIVAGNLSGNSPNGPGYLAWLLGKGFTQAQFDSSDFAVDVTDSGVDNGTTSPNHFGLYLSGTQPGTSRVIYNRLEGTAKHGSTLQGLDGHGNLNAHIIAGFNDLIGFPHADASGFRYGLGICPFVKVGSSVIFDPDSYTSPDFEDLQSRAYRDSARVSNNSWGNTSGNTYNSYSQRYDALVRDAQPTGAAVANAGNQEMVIVFAAGNSGSSANTVHPPATGKNVFTIAAGENVHPFSGSDGSGVADSGADSLNDIIYFSSRGPCADGRIKPDIAAPGTHVSGGVAQSANPGSNGTAIAGFDGSGVSGGPFGSSFWPTNQQFFTASSGTSHSTPGVAGGCALIRQYFINQGRNAPSPAMTKAYLMNSTRYMTGTGANDTLPSNNQGMGLMDLGRAFDGVPRFLCDQLTNALFTATGQTRVFAGRVADTGKPLRITLAWTDAPGNTTGNAYNNDLNLTVDIAGNSYKGNVFSGTFSTTGGVSDVKNNVESIILPAGVSGVFTVTVTAANINSDGVPNYGTGLDQDFALVIYNTMPLDDLAVLPSDGLSSSGFAGGSFSPSNKAYALTNTGGSNLSWAAGCPSNWVAVVPGSGTIAAGQTNLVTVSFNANANSLGAGTNTSTIVFSNITSGISQSRSVQLVVRPRELAHFAWSTIAATQYVGQSFPVTITAQDAENNTMVSFINDVALGGQTVTSGALLADDVEGGTNGWTHSGTRDMWHISTNRNYSANHAWYCGNEITKIYSNSMNCSLTSPTVTIGTGAKLIFQHWYYAESGYDYAYVDVSTNNWFSYNTLATFNGIGNSWRGQTNDLSAYTGWQAQIRFRFYTDSSVVYEGWFIDDITIGENTQPPIAIIPTNSGNFVSGVWNGVVTVLEPATNMHLRADDGIGHSGTSGVFTVLSGSPDDLDNDGIPNWWEQLYFGDPVSANPAGICSNGINTVREAYIAGLNPNDQQSAFMASFTDPLSSANVLQWQGISGRVYTIYWSSNLFSTFTPMQSNYTGGVFTDTVHSSANDGFYRIEVRLAP